MVYELYRYTKFSENKGNYGTEKSACVTQPYPYTKQNARTKMLCSYTQTIIFFCKYICIYLPHTTRTIFFAHIRAYTTPFIGSPKQNFIIIPCAKVEAFPVFFLVCVCISLTVFCILSLVLANYYKKTNKQKKLKKYNPNDSFNVFIQFFTLSILTVYILGKGEPNFFVSVNFYYIYIYPQHKENFP